MQDDLINFGGSLQRRTAKRGEEVVERVLWDVGRLTQQFVEQVVRVHEAERPGPCSLRGSVEEMAQRQRRRRRRGRGSGEYGGDADDIAAPDVASRAPLCPPLAVLVARERLQSLVNPRAEAARRRRTNVWKR